MSYFRAGRLGLVLVLVVVGFAACSDDDAPVPTHVEGLLGPKLNLSMRPFGAAADSAERLLATRLDAAAIGMGRINGDTVNREIAVGSVPTDVTLSADGLVAYVTNQFDHTVGFVSVATATQVATVSLPGSTFRVRVGSGSTLYVSTNVAKVYSLNTVTHAITDSVAVGGDPNGLALSPDGTRLYVGNRSSGTVSEVETATMTVLRTFTVGAVPQDVAISRAGDELYVADESGPMKVVNLGTGEVTAAGDETSFLFGLALSPDGTQLLGSRPGAGEVLLMDRATRAVQRTLATGGTPRRVAYTPVGNLAVVANEAGWVDRMS